MGYRHWPPDPSESPRHGSDPWTTGEHQYGEWSTQHGGQGVGAGWPEDHGTGYTGYDRPTGYTYGADPDATYVYQAVPPTSGARHRSRPEPKAERPPKPVDEPVDDPAPMPALAWTAGFFVVPVLLYLVWAATRSGQSPPGCIDPSGAPCDPPRAEALAGLVGFLPSLAGALTLALLATLALRRVAVGWRASTVAFAASIVGAGTATLIASMVG